MRLGDWQLDTVSGGTFRLDGGAMFGVVPKPAWDRHQPADAQNRIRLATNCVLARGPHGTVVIDTGYGNHFDAKQQGQMEMQSGQPLIENLADVGVSPEAVDLVVFSHLHFDHSGGAVTATRDGVLEPAFPKATYVSARREWNDAVGGAAELRGAYPSYLRILLDSGRLRLVEGGEEIVPGLTAIRTGGHTRGHQALMLESGGQRAVYLGDLCPTHTHMRMLWGMGYDTFPLTTRRRKREMLAEAADDGHLVLWDHDATMAAARISRHPEKEFVVEQQFAKL